MRKLFTCLSLALLAISTSASSLAASGAPFPVVRLQLGMYQIKAELASTPAQREQGLMHREKLAPNEGMLFDFEAPAHVCMWMKNTRIPLSVAFIDQDGVIVNIEDMAPMTKTNHCGKKPVRYALEMNQGWFKRRNLNSGSKVTLLP